jgi:uncharacterized repeat protein (TIGR01451 family)
MAYPRYLVLAVVAIAAGTLCGQLPTQSREPPLADDPEVVQVRGQTDPDDVVPPAKLPGDLNTTPGIITVGANEVIAPAGALPTPAVTLDIEGNDVSPTGQAVVYKLIVRNTSRAKAHNVVVRVIPPKNAEKVKADPPATHDEADTRWELKTLDPGQSRTIEVAYKPKADAEEVKLQARVQFDFGRGMITKVSAPTLSVKKEGPEKVVVGDTVSYRITVTNNGKVTVKDIEVKEYLNKGLVYEDRELSRGSVDGRLMSAIDPKTGERMWSIPTLAPGDSKAIDYRVKARDPGKISSTVLVKAADVSKQTGFDTEVMTAQLEVSAEGPPNDRGTVGQAAMFKIVVENKGSADLKNVTVRCMFPPDMRATKATNSGQPFRDSVQWIFKELQPGDRKELNVGLTTSTPGARTIQFAVKADKGPEQKAQVKTTFAGVPALSWDTDVPGTVAAGKTMTYRVTVANTGSADARATKLRVDLPPNVDLISTKPNAGLGLGPNSKEVNFLASDIPAGKKTTYTIEVRARAPGEARAIFQLSGEGVGSEPAEHRKSTSVTGSDSRSPAGPPPAKLGSNNIGRRDP